MIELDQDLIRRAKRAPRKDELTEGERIAMNLFWRQGVRVPVLARIFQSFKKHLLLQLPHRRRLELSALRPGDSHQCAH